MNPHIVPCFLAGIPIGMLLRRLPEPIKSILLLILMVPFVFSSLPKTFIREFINSGYPDLRYGMFVFFGCMAGVGTELAAVAGLRVLREKQVRHQRILAGEERYTSAAAAKLKAEAWADWWAIGISIVAFLALEIGPFLLVDKFEDRDGFFAHVTWLVLSGVVFLIARAIHGVIHTIALSIGIRRYRVHEAEEIGRLKSQIHKLSSQLERLRQDSPIGDELK